MSKRPILSRTYPSAAAELEGICGRGQAIAPKITTILKTSTALAKMPLLGLPYYRSGEVYLFQRWAVRPFSQYTTPVNWSEFMKSRG